MGGNQGQTNVILNEAISKIESMVGRVIKVSDYYVTKAWGPVQQDDFLNVAVEIRTFMPPKFLLNSLLQIEKHFGRRRDVKYGPRTLDIDILFYANKVIKTEELLVPHPEIQNRRFALVPCYEIIPNLMHPVLKKSITHLLSICPDKLEVNKWKS